MAMRIVLSLVAAATLSACNVVMSEAPLFDQADAAKAPPFKDGEWLAMSGECLAGWTNQQTPPDCARHGQVRGGRLVIPDDDAQDVLMAGGEPLILQIRFSQKDASSGEPFVMHIYGALKPTARDAQGRITEARNWLVLCGPPPPEAKGSSLNTWEHLTNRPLPGLAIDRKLGICRAREAAAVRRAAAASEAWDDEKGVLRWVEPTAP
ncbi:MAG: hypothetical protein ABW042_02405 [Phenylobacterium sp.]